MKIKTLLLCTALTFTLSVSAANAAGPSSGPRYVPRAEISQSNSTAETRWEDHSDRRSYEAYEEREPCQNYRAEPRNYEANCPGWKAQEVTAPMQTAVTKTVEEKRLLPVVQSYTILFDHDKSQLRDDETDTLNKITQEIKRYDPLQVTVTGYTDTSGDAGYNQTLSRQREQAVSTALMSRGIENQTLERDARGEYEQAVPTADDTKNQENRRVVVDFRR